MYKKKDMPHPAAIVFFAMPHRESFVPIHLLFTYLDPRDQPKREMTMYHSLSRCQTTQGAVDTLADRRPLIAFEAAASF